MLNKLEKHDLNCNIFSAYDYNGLTIQELLCQFFTKINECVDLSNKTIDLSQWLVNEGLSLEVSKKLETWLNDGSLNDIINKEIFGELDNKITLLQTKINVKEFGAKGDGVSDDTLSIQKAIDSANNGDIIFFPSGTYLITKDINIDRECVTLQGDDNFDSRSSNIKGVGNRINIFNVLRYGVIFKGLTFFGNTNHENGFDSGNITAINYNIVQYAGNDSYISNCSFMELDIAILIRARNVIIDTCLFGVTRKCIEVIDSNHTDGMGGAIRGITVTNNVFHAIGNSNNSVEGVDCACVDIKVCKLSQDIVIKNNKIEAWSSTFFKGYINGVELVGNVANNVVGGFKFIDIKSMNINSRCFKISDNTFNGDYTLEENIANHNFIFCGGDLLNGDIRNNIVTGSGKECVKVVGKVSEVDISDNRYSGDYLNGYSIMSFGSLEKCFISDNTLRSLNGGKGAIEIIDKSNLSRTSFNNNKSVNTLPFEGFDFDVKIKNMSTKITCQNTKTQLISLDYNNSSSELFEVSFQCFVINNNSDKNIVSLHCEIDGSVFELGDYKVIEGNSSEMMKGSVILKLNSRPYNFKLYCTPSNTLDVDYGYWVQNVKIGTSFLKVTPFTGNIHL